MEIKKTKISQFLNEYNSIFDVTPPVTVETMNLSEILLQVDIECTNTSDTTPDADNGDDEDDMFSTQEYSDVNWVSNSPLWTSSCDSTLVSSQEPDDLFFNTGESTLRGCRQDSNELDTLMDNIESSSDLFAEDDGCRDVLPTIPSLRQMHNIVTAALIQVVQPQTRRSRRKCATTNHSFGLLQLIPSIFNPAYIQV
jgi:hypothetical protein